MRVNGQRVAVVYMEKSMVNDRWDGGTTVTIIYVAAEDEMNE